MRTSKFHRRADHARLRRVKAASAVAELLSPSSHHGDDLLRWKRKFHGWARRSCENFASPGTPEPKAQAGRRRSDARPHDASDALRKKF